MRVVKVRARPASLLPSRSRVVRSDVRGEFSFSHHEGSRAPSTSFPSLTARAIFPPLLLLSQPDHEWRSASGAHASDVASATTRSLRELDRHPREVSVNDASARRGLASSSSRVAFGKTVPSDDPRIVTFAGKHSFDAFSRSLVSDALDRSSRAYDSRRPGPGPPRPAPRPPPPRDHPPWSNPPETSPARPRATTEPRSRRTSRLAKPLAKPPFAPRWIASPLASRSRKTRVPPRFEIEDRTTRAVPSRRSSGSSRVSRDRTTPRCPCFTATIVGSDPAPRTPICFWANRRTPGSWSSPSATPKRRRRRKRRRRPGFDGGETRRRIPRLRSFDSRTVRGISRRRTPRARRSLRSVRLVRVVFAARAEARRSPARRRAAAAFGSRATPRTAWRRDA